MQKKALNLSRSHQTVFKNTKSKVEYQANFGDSSGAIFYDVIFIGFSLVIVYCFRMWKEDDLAILCTAYSMIGVIVEWEIDHNFYALRRRTIELRAEDTRESRDTRVTDVKQWKLGTVAGPKPIILVKL